MMIDRWNDRSYAASPLLRVGPTSVRPENLLDEGFLARLKSGLLIRSVPESGPEAQLRNSYAYIKWVIRMNRINWVEIQSKTTERLAHGARLVIGESDPVGWASPTTECVT